MTSQTFLISWCRRSWRCSRISYQNLFEQNWLNLEKFCWI